MNTQTQAQAPVVNLTIDGRMITVPKGTTVYHAAKQLEIDIPVFCYQDRMPPFGACRMCLVEVEKTSKLQTSCTLEATEGMIVRTQSQLAVDGREDILEFLLINHPLDCPICDRGGECPLQEHVFNHGPGLSRFFEEKRHFKKPLPLGPVLMLDRERCIVCARCTRFGDIIAGDHALELLDRGYKTEVGTPNGQPVDSKFIGNTIAICPVGALTSQVYRFRARPWDNDPTPSTCTLCPVGCSLYLDSRDGEIMRTRNHENKEVNDIWLCDKGWFGYEFSSNPQRLERPLIRRNGQLEAASWDEALSLIASKIQEFKPSKKLAALGGNPLTVEENYLYQKFMRECAGVNHIDYRVGMPIVDGGENIVQGMEISIGDCEKLSYAYLLGVDLTEEFPVIWLRLKQAINRGAKVIFIGNYAPEIYPHLFKNVLHSPGKEIETLQEQFVHIQELAKGGKGALFVGRQYLATRNRQAILTTLSQMSQNIPDLSLNILEGKGNSWGAHFAGMRPDYGPENEKLPSPGLNVVEIIETGANEGWDYLHVAGANPAMKYPEKTWKQLRDNLKFLVVQDLFLTETANMADVVLPTLCFVEKGGSFINVEGRIQHLLPGKELPPDIYSDGDIFMKIAMKMNISLFVDPKFQNFLNQERLSFPQRSFDTRENIPFEPVTHEMSAVFAPLLFDHGVRMNHNSHVLKLSKNPGIRMHPSEGQKRGLQNGEKIHIETHGLAISGDLKWDSQVATGTVVLPLGFPEIPIQNLGMNVLNGLEVKIQKIEGRMP